MSRGRLGLFRSDDRRSPLQRARRLALQAISLARLPRPVAVFWLRALRSARAAHDTWSIDVACRPAELLVLLDALADARRVAEVGTAAAWTTSCIALARPDREIHSWDVEAHPERERYLALLAPADRARVHLHDRPGGRGPADPPPVDAVFIDSSHEREETVATFRTWEPAVVPGGIVAFHDWEDAAYPGVIEAVRELGLLGEARGHLFVWRKPG
ncbi:MAG TPA: class I SAM-dependent methyltransferase [Solirubrobacteraceae bacterium]|jgi:predicted O-methyltransferase YrrM|nr:class I SAM-dependent methyltransferase [Solirubrobacteraceae bacterium]